MVIHHNTFQLIIKQEISDLSPPCPLVQPLRGEHNEFKSQTPLFVPVSSVST